MKAAEKGVPQPPRTGSRTIGARPNIDIPVNEIGLVEPEMGGISVSPNSEENLPPYRRPPAFGGTGKDPLWELETENLPDELAYRPDPDDPDRHGFIEPSRVMTFNRYQGALRLSRNLWRPVE